MTIQQVLFVIAYSIQPYLWLIAMALVALLAAFLMGSVRRGQLSPQAYPLAAAVGVVTALLAPTLTGSRLVYVATITDWLALTAVGIGTACYTLLLLWPLLRKPN